MKGKVRDSITASVKDGLGWAVMSGFVEAYITPFSLALGASPVQVGFIKSFPSLLGAVAQVFTEKFLKFFGTRRAMVADLCFVQASVLCGFALTPALPDGLRLGIFMLFAVLYTALGLVVNPPWASLMADYLPTEKRGAFLGWRERFIGCVYVGTGLVAGTILNAFGRGTLYGFVLLFAVGSAARFISVHYLRQMYEPPLKAAAKDSSSFIMFLLKARKDNVAIFTASCGALLLGTYLAAPFFSVYLLEGLHVPYWQYMVVMLVGPLTTYLTSKKWGELADKHGCLAVLRIAVVCIPFVALFWSLSRNFYVLVLIETFSGVVWAAYVRGSGNFIYDAVPANLRAKYIGFFGVVVGAAQFAGTLAGGYLYVWLPKIGGHAFIAVLILSTTMRMLSAIPFLIKLKPVRVHKPLDRETLLKAFMPKFFWNY